MELSGGSFVFVVSTYYGDVRQLQLEDLGGRFVGPLYTTLEEAIAALPVALRAEAAGRRREADAIASKLERRADEIEASQAVRVRAIGDPDPRPLHEVGEDVTA